MRLTRSAAAAAAALAAALSGAAAPGTLRAQALTLQDALQRARRAAYPVRIAEAEAAAGAGQATASLQGILPTVRVEGGWMQTTDPLNAFGFTLRQRAVTLASFDPASLNYPPATTNVSSGLVVELPLINVDAWAGRSAAADASAAAADAARWSTESAALDVARAYYGALLAADRVSTLDAALAAAREHERVAASLLRNGVVTKSDALIAGVKAGEVEAMLIAARSDAALARQQLALAMGTPADTLFSLPAALPAAAPVRALADGVRADSAAHAARADVRAAREASAAASADLSRAKAAYIPRVNSFGRLDWNDPTTPFGGTDSWTVGVMVSWVPFAGASQIGGVQAAKGRTGAAAAAAEAAQARAALELRQANDALTVALARLGIAERAVDQSVEAHRIVSRKYDGGLATIVELFDAAAVETQTRLAFADARYQAIVAAAGRLHALGLPLAPITTLDR